MDNSKLADEWLYYNPVHVIAGVGTFSKLDQFVPHTGTILLVTTPGFTQRGLTGNIHAQLGKNRVLVYDQIVPNPNLDDLDLATIQLRQESIHCIIALGGGSVIDAAKVLAVTLPSSMANPLDHVLRSCLDYVWKNRIPVFAIPTTSGTGAEVTPFATVWDNTAHKKYSVTGDFVYPTHALLDPMLTLTLPRRGTLYPALDAISHALESLWNKNRTPISEIYAIRALTLAQEALPILLENSQNLKQRTKMQWASLLAGLAISQTRTAIGHSISYPLTSHFGVPHGLACSFMLPTILNKHIENLVEDVLNRRLLENVASLLDSLNLKEELSQYVSKDQIESVMGEMFTKERANNFAYSYEKNDLLRALVS